MGILELKYNDKSIKIKSKILQKLKELQFYWLIDSEVESAVIEIKNNTIIWQDGIYRSGNWKYGIFKNGGFYGIWENGIWENGTFKGNWKSGLNKPV